MRRGQRGGEAVVTGTGTEPANGPAQGDQGPINPGQREAERVDAQGAASAAATGTPSKMSWLKRILREPLIQFMLMGAAIFAAHAAVTPAVPKERLIEVTPTVRQSIIDTFKTAHEGRAPQDEELKRLVDVWILNEITYREALAQGLDKGDDMIRDRITHKMRLLIFGGVQVKEPTPEELAAWYEKRRQEYDIPDLVSFIQVPFTGANAEAEAKATVSEIQAGTEPQDVQMRAMIFAERPRQSLEPAYGKDFVDQLVALPKGQWQALKSTDGWEVVRLDTFTPGRRVELGEVAAQVAQAWKDEQRRIQGIAATRDLGNAYVIHRGEL